MDESNVMKPDTENSNLSRKSSTADVTSSSVKTVDPLHLHTDHSSFICRSEIWSWSNYFTYLKKLPRLQSLQMYICWLLNDDLRVWWRRDDVCCGHTASFCCRNWITCKIASTIRFFIVAPTQALISYIRVLSSVRGVVLYVRCSTLSSAAICSYSEHCPNYEMCSFSNSMHLTEHITLQHVWHGSRGETDTHQVT